MASRGSLEAWAWLFGTAVIAGALASVAAVEDRAFLRDPGLVPAILAFAVLAVAVWALFAGLAHAVARRMHGSGRYGTAVYLLAAFTAPLMVLASVLHLMLPEALLSIGVPLYWLFLSVVATQTAYELPRIRATIAVLTAFLVMGVLLVGAAVALGLWIAVRAE